MADETQSESTGEARTPLSQLGILASQEVEIAPGISHLELYTRGGLLSVVWHGGQDAETVAVMGGGAMGGTLGPAGGLYHDLGQTFAERGIGTMRVGYRAPGNLSVCIHDMAAAAQIAALRGAQRFVTVGHSFGGAVAIGVAAGLPDPVRGVVTLATQSAGCEPASRLGDRPLLLVHGEADEILPPQCSEMVRGLVPSAELVLYPGTGHMLREVGEELRVLLGEWIPTVLSDPGLAAGG